MTSTTTTIVCNCKVQFLRPQYKNLREWCTHTDSDNNKNNVYIGRAGVVFIDKQRYPTESSLWANPFKIGRDGDRDEVIRKYRRFITHKIATEPEKYDVQELRGKRLGCWCIGAEMGGETSETTPLLCHGQVLLELIQAVNQ